jgi:uracil-DNA glycosylase family 4
VDALAALRLQIEWGADEALADTPVDRTLAAPRPPAAARRTTASTTAPALPAASRAQLLAGAAETIASLRLAVAGVTDCPLAGTATNLVFADGAPHARLVFVDEAPGPEEDLTGKPLAGRAGLFLDKMMASIGLDRTQVLLTSLIPWRPPGNRPPTEAEVAMCLPFLQRHLALVQPRIIVTLGALSTHALLGRNDGIRRLRGKWAELVVEPDKEAVKILPMLHPAHLLRTPAAKREAWADFLALRHALDAL